MNAWTSERLGGIHGQRTDYWSQLGSLIISGATDCRDVGSQRQLLVDDNTLALALSLFLSLCWDKAIGPHILSNGVPHL